MKSPAERQRAYRERQKFGIPAIAAQVDRAPPPPSDDTAVQQLRRDVDYLSEQMEEFSRRLAKIEELAEGRR